MNHASQSLPFFIIRDPVEGSLLVLQASKLFSLSFFFVSLKEDHKNGQLILSVYRQAFDKKAYLLLKADHCDFHCECLSINQEVL